MADSKKSDIQSGRDIEATVPVVQSYTESTPAEADKSSLPNAQDAQSEQPPVRAVRPDTAIAQVLAAGAGAHNPPDPDVYGPDGRVRMDESGPATLDPKYKPVEL